VSRDQGTSDIKALGIIDCDVHIDPPEAALLFPYLEEHWREYVQLAAYKLPASVAVTYPPGAPTTRVREARVPGEWSVDKEYDLLRTNVLDRRNVRAAILTCFWGIEVVNNPDFSAAAATAVNDWVRDHWLARDGRLRGSIVVTPQDPTAAAAEINRLGEDSRFAQVLLPVRAERPYGHRRYFPLFEAAERHHLPVAVHFGGMTGLPPTPSGWPSSYVEDYVVMAQIFQSQLMSIIASGVLDQYPRLKIVFMESGFTWLTPLLWRLDAKWKGMQREAPWVKRPPSAYVREHVRITTQPLDRPRSDERMLDELQQMPSAGILMFSSDYPHRHAADVDKFLLSLPDDYRRAIASGTALDAYGDRLLVSDLKK
jgi:predicted TIM-barrel fold metal-dependent hydrolase